jgi:hypothetical protein
MYGVKRFQGKYLHYLNLRLQKIKAKLWISFKIYKNQLNVRFQ